MNFAISLASPPPSEAFNAWGAYLWTYSSGRMRERRDARTESCVTRRHQSQWVIPDAGLTMAVHDASVTAL